MNVSFHMGTAALLLGDTAISLVSSKTVTVA